MRSGRIQPTALACVFALSVMGCARPATPSAWVDAKGRHELPPDFARGLSPFDARVGARVRLLGARIPAEAALGARIDGELLWLVEKDCAGLSPKVFVHATAEGAELNLAQSDHEMVGGALSPTEWRKGDVLADRLSFVVPRELAVDELSVRVGLFEGKERWRVEPAAAHDGTDRIEVARVRIAGAPPLRVRADVMKRQGPIAIDGAADDPDWARSAPLPLLAYDGKSKLGLSTTAKMLWDDSALYLLFVAEDPDAFSPYTKRDDPLYESEAYEIFIDADGDADVYVELQSSVNDVHFDAAFSGGRRKNMDKRYDAAFETKTRVDGARVTQEWRIPIADLRDVPVGEPKVGAEWRINLFRLERVRDGDKQRVLRNEASAWSPPLSGDFHNIARMGTITFR